MALSARLCSRALWRNQSLISASLCRNVSIVAQPAQPPIVETHDEKNARLKRPQSPHLTIYKFQLTSLLSITHRFAGLALTGYVAGVGVLSLASSQPFIEVIHSLHGTNPALILIGKLLIASPFAYHFCNGIRHLIWDSGKSLTIKGVYTSGYAMLGAAAVLTIALLSL